MFIEYVIGMKYDIIWKIFGKEFIGKINSEKNIEGMRSNGMNWNACTSFLANVDVNIPKSTQDIA